MGSLVAVYAGLVVLAPLCALGQRAWPAREGVPPIGLRARRVDWLYWIVTPLGTGVLTRAVTLALAAGLALAFGYGRQGALHALEVFHTRSPLPFGHVPRWSQAIVALVLVDFVSYWSHRVRHRRYLWRLHSVHHAPTRLDWLAAARMHPLDDLADNVVVTLPVLLLGFDPIVFLAIGPALILHTLYLHAAVDWTLGPLGRVIASPAFHRLHHSTDPRASNANFGGVLSLWDTLFGTYLAPSSEGPPLELGLGEERFDESIRAQLVVPFRRIVEDAVRASEHDAATDETASRPP